MRTHNIHHVTENQKDIPTEPLYLVLWLTLTSSNYPCLQHISMVPKVFEPLKFYCIFMVTKVFEFEVLLYFHGYQGVWVWSSTVFSWLPRCLSLKFYGIFMVTKVFEFEVLLYFHGYQGVWVWSSTVFSWLPRCLSLKFYCIFMVTKVFEFEVLLYFHGYQGVWVWSSTVFWKASSPNEGNQKLQKLYLPYLSGYKTGFLSL